MPIIASTRSACNEDDTRERYGYTMSPSGRVASTALWMQQALVAMAVAANRLALAPVASKAEHSLISTH